MVAMRQRACQTEMATAPNRVTRGRLSFRIGSRAQRSKSATMTLTNATADRSGNECLRAPEVGSILRLKISGDDLRQTIGLLLQGTQAMPSRCGSRDDERITTIEVSVQ